MTQNAGPGAFDPSVPNVARIYDFMLGGKDNYAADRQAAQQVLEQIPHSQQACRQNRDFLGRVARYLADSQGITQFLDIGSGLPTQDNVHQIAQRANPGAQVVYVDYDKVVAAHATALLKKGTAGVTVVQADIRDPDAILAGAATLLDFTRPVAVLMFAILHFLTDDDQPHDAVKVREDPRRRSTPSDRHGRDMDVLRTQRSLRLLRSHLLPQPLPPANSLPPAAELRKAPCR